MGILDEIVITAKRKHLDTGYLSNERSQMSGRQWAIWQLEGLDDDGNPRCVSIMESSSRTTAVLIWLGLPDPSEVMRRAEAAFYMSSGKSPAPYFHAKAVTNCPDRARLNNAVHQFLESAFSSGDQKALVRR